MNNYRATRIADSNGIRLGDLRALPTIGGIGRDPKRTSNKYVFVDTYEVCRAMYDRGWVATQACQQGDGHYGKHFVRFAHPTWGVLGNGDKYNILFYSAHDGSRGAWFYEGMDIAACLNGLVVASQMFSQRGYTHLGNIREQVWTVLDNVGISADSTLSQIDHFRGIGMESAGRRLAYMDKALKVRFPDHVLPAHSLTQMSMPKRAEQQELNLWNVFNQAQEWIMKGGFQIARPDKVNKEVRAWNKARPITAVDKTMKYNQELWEVTKEFAMLTN